MFDEEPMKTILPEFCFLATLMPLITWTYTTILRVGYAIEYMTLLKDIANRISSYKVIQV